MNKDDLIFGALITIAFVAIFTYITNKRDNAMMHLCPDNQSKTLYECKSRQ